MRDSGCAAPEHPSRAGPCRGLVAAVWLADSSGGLPVVARTVIPRLKASNSAVLDLGSVCHEFLFVCSCGKRVVPSIELSRTMLDMLTACSHYYSLITIWKFPLDFP